MINIIDVKEILELVASARSLILDHEAASHVKVKGRSDYVTQVDFSVQQYFQEKLRDRYPDIQFMGEEEKVQVDLTRPCWILDPVDGTANLIHDLQLSCISLALYDGQEVCFGVVCNPFSGETFHAQKGKGVFLNGEPVCVSRTASMEDAIIGFGSSPYYREMTDDNFTMFRRIFDACSDFRRLGSAAIELAYVACGRLDGYMERRLSPWDFAAGMLLVKEAGGSVCDFDGKPLGIAAPTGVVAANGILDKELFSLIS